MVLDDYVEVVIDYFCLGEPTLKCCRRISRGNCWTAFNTEAPINCEGNPHYGPTYTAGLCLRPCPSGCAGCLCNYLAECDSDAGPLSGSRRQLLRATAPDRATWFSIGRMASFYPAISRVLRGRPALSTDNRTTALEPTDADKYGVPSFDASASSQLLDFIFYRGCVNFAQNARLLARSVPPLNITNYRGRVISRVDDLVDEMLPIRAALPNFAISRLGADVPDFWRKVDKILGTAWNATSRASALADAGINDPEAELLKYVDLGGLLLLRGALPENWVLFAVPIPDSNRAKRRSTKKLSHCRERNGRGRAVEILSFEIRVEGRKAALSVKVVDPLLSRKMLARVSWGDASKLEDSVLDGLDGRELQLEASHDYGQCNPSPQVTVQIVNKSGLMALMKKTVSPRCEGSASDLSSSPYPPIASVKVTLEVTRVGNPFGRPGSQLYYFQSAQPRRKDLSAETVVRPHVAMFEPLGVRGSPGAREPSNVTFTLTSQSRAPMKYIRFTCRTFRNFIYTTVSAKVVAVQLQLVSGVSVDAAFQAVTHDDGESLRCSRRGNLFEDVQGFFVIRLDPAGAGTASLDNSSKRSADELTADGFYKEVLPGSFQYTETLKVVPRFNDRRARFTAYVALGEKMMDCDALASKRKSVRTWYCRTIEGAKDRCKASCDTCALNRPRSCRDSTETEAIPAFKRKLKKSCKWLQAQDTDTIEVNCRSEKIAESCARTCDA